MIKMILRRCASFSFAYRMIRWHASYYLLGRGTPLSAGVYITSKCNCRCLLCNVWKQQDSVTCRREDQMRAIDALAKLGCVYYSVSGGEPTLVDDLPDRLAYAARKIPYVHLVTNGQLMTGELAGALAAAGVAEVSVSIDGMQRMHDRLRGVDGAFVKAIGAIETLRTRAPSVDIVVNSIITPFSLDSLRELKAMLARFPGVKQKYLAASRHRLFGTAEAAAVCIEGERAAPAEEIGRFLDEAARDPNVVNSAAFLRAAKRHFGGAADAVPRQKKCLYPCHAVEFDAHGRAFACLTGMEFSNGIPPESDLESALRSTAYKRTQRRLAGCHGCKGKMMLCYLEPRLNFPLHNLISGWLGA